MHVAKVVDVRDEKRGEDAERTHLLQLVEPQQLRVDHDRPECGKLWILGGHGADRAQELRRRGVAVAVGKQLHAARRGLPERPFHLRVGHGAVAAVTAAGVGFAQPGRAPLRRAVQKDLHAADAQAPLVAGRGKQRAGAVERLRGRVGYGVEHEQAALLQRAVDREQLLRQQPLLHGGDAVGRIAALCADKGAGERLQVRQRHRR